MDDINYRSLLLSAPFGYAYHRILLDGSGAPCDYEFVEANAAFGALTGLDAAHLGGRRITELMPGIRDEAFDWIRFYGNVALSGGSQVFEQYSEHLARWYKVHVYSNERGYFATTFIDISGERAKASELENFFNVNLDLLCIADLQGNFLKVNKEWESMLGYSADDLERRTFLEFVHPEDIDSTLEAMSQLGNNQSVLQFVNRYRASDGTYRHIEWRSFPHGDEIYAAARDITQRIEYEQSIKDNAGYINALLAAIPDAIFVIGSSGDILDFKENSSSKVSLPTVSCIGQPYSAVLPEKAAQQIKTNIERINYGGKPEIFQYHTESDGQTHHFECTMVPFGESKNIAIIRDITERHSIQQELSESISQLSAAMDATADGIIIVGSDMQIVKWNKKFEELWHIPQHIIDAVKDGRLPDSVMLNTVAQQIQDRTSFLNTVYEIYAIPSCARYDILALADGRVFERYTQPQTIGDHIVGRVWSFRDITSSKEAEKQLLQQTERFELAVNGSNDGIWDWDVKSGVFYMSPKFKEQIGYRDEELPNIIESLYLNLHPGDRERVLTDLSDYLQQRRGEVCDLTFRMMHRGGGFRWIRSRSKAIWDGSGQVVRVAGSHTDITEQRLLEEAVALSAKNFRTFYESIEDLVIIADMDGVIIEANPTALSTLRYTRSEICGKPLVFIHNYDMYEAAENMYRAASRKERSRFNIPLQSKYSESIPAESRITFGQWDGHPSMFVVAKDMRNIEDSQQRFNVIFENNPALMTISNLQMEMISVNDSFRKLTGYTNEELIGKRPEQLKLFAENTLPNHAVVSIFDEHRVSNVEMMLHTKSGRVITVLYSGEILHSKGLNYYLSVMVDITAQKEAEAAAIKASKAKSEFLANMSHEIRTPLNGVIGFTELMKNTPLSPIQKQYIDNANVSAHSLLSLINDILDLSKIEAGKIELDIISADIIELAENAIDIIKLQATRKGLELLLDIGTDVPRIAEIDPQRLRQVLVNLLSNAIKFTDRGEVELTLQFVPVDDQCGVFTFRVRDTGIGISDEQRPKLFRVFSQGDASTTRKYGGTGLGLVISNLIAEKMGSNIELESQLGYGSTFYFSFTTRYRNAEGLSAKKLPHIRRVLIADDNANNRLILSRTLSSWGTESDSCASGSEALVMVQRARYDVLIIDQQMPVMDGLETIKILRESTEQSDMPVIVLYSSADDVSIRARCAEYGVKFSLVKPVKASDLYSFLNNIGCSANMPAMSEIKSAPVPDMVIDRNPYTILVAEDVQLNLVLVTAMLHQLLPNAEIVDARNGQLALQYLTDKSADLVLMDIQMPVMDGIEATKLIRAGESGTEFHVPIIALSAGALNDEKMKCIDAGMDDFLSKPIDFKPLAEVLRTYLLGTGTNTDMQMNAAELPSYDSDTLMARIGYDSAMFDMLMNSALTIGDMIDGLSAAIASGDAEAIENEAHKIKGASLNLSFNKLAQCAKYVESHAAGDVQLLQSHLDDMRREWDYLRTIVPALHR